MVFFFLNPQSFIVISLKMGITTLWRPDVCTKIIIPVIFQLWGTFVCVCVCVFFFVVFCFFELLNLPE